MNISRFLNNLCTLIGSVLTISGEGIVTPMPLIGLNVIYKSKDNSFSRIIIENGGFKGVQLVEDKFYDFICNDRWRSEDGVVLWRRPK